MVWPHLKVFWFSKDDSTGHNEKQKKKMWEDSIKEWTGMDFANSAGAAENRTRWKGIVAKPSKSPTTLQGYGID